MIQVQANPLERLGISQEMVRRFCAQNGVGVHDLGKLIQTVSRHGSSPFHTDRNQTPGADQIFKDIQQAASEVDSEEKLGAAAISHLEKPATQIEHMREQFNLRLALITSKYEELEGALAKVLLGLPLGNDLFEMPDLQVNRFSTTVPNLSLLSKDGYIDFCQMFYDDRNTNCEYLVDSDGSLRKYNLVRFKDPIAEDAVETYTPKPDELIFGQIEPLSTGLSDPDIEQIDIYHHYFRDGEGQKLEGTKIIGSLNLGDLLVNEINEVLCNLFSLPHSDPKLPTEGLRAWRASKTNNSTNIATAKKELEGGFSTERFMLLLKHFLPSVRFGHVIVAYKKDRDKERFILLGANNPLHEKTPGLYKED